MNKTARWVLNASRKIRTNELMKKCNWLKINDLIELHSGKLSN